LPDGSLLQLISISFTNGPHYYKGKGVTGWREKLAIMLPRPALGLLGWSLSGGSMTIDGRANGTNLAAFTICQMADKNNFQFFANTHLQVFDDLGNTFDGGAAMGTMGSFGGRNSYRVDGWTPPAFPRRGRTIGFRYFEKINETWQPVAEFVFPNPAVENYPTWTPEAIPATKSDGDLSVTLERLQSGLSKADWARAAASNEVAVTEATFHLTQAGHAANDWRPVSVNISDATGNDWLANAYYVTVKHEADSDSPAFDGALWPGEAAWKLRCEFSRVTNFAPEEIFTFSNIPMPGATDVNLLDNSTNIAGTKLQLVAITGESAEQPGNLKWSTVKKYVNISVRTDPSEWGKRLTLLKITDESGREAEVHRDYDWGGPERVYAFKPLDGAKEVSFTFAYHQSRFVEFLAKPEFFRPN
jgi:hypothetical protein